MIYPVAAFRAANLDIAPNQRKVAGWDIAMAGMIGKGEMSKIRRRISTRGCVICKLMI
jgi:hypothetical protein